MQLKILGQPEPSVDTPCVHYCDPKRVRFEKRADGQFQNIRGRIKDVSGLQASVVEAGNRILQPVQLKMVDGALVCVEGHRRTIVARNLGIPLPYLLVEVDGQLDTLDWMLVSNVRKNFPPLILDKEGGIIGGLAYAVSQKVQQGKSPLQIGRLMGYKTDKSVRLLIDLYQADVAVRKAVAAGRMSLQAFATIRNTAPAQQTAVMEAIEAEAEDKDSIKFTKDNLRKAAKEKHAQEQPFLLLSDEPTVVEKLNQLKHQLLILLSAQNGLGPREKAILVEIKEIANV